MSKINSPFLDNEEGKQSANNNETEINQDSSHLMNYQPQSSNDNKIVSQHDDEGEIEIKDDGKLLKNIIIALIIFLILAILGLVLYNFIFSKKKQADQASQQAIQRVEPDSNVEVNNFEMKSRDFKAGSIVVE